MHTGARVAQRQLDRPRARQRGARCLDRCRVAERLGRFLAAGGALEGRMAERLLVPAILCAAGLGARAGTAPTCHFTTSSVTEGLISLATLARRMLPVKAVVDGAVGEEGVVVVAPDA